MPFLRVFRFCTSSARNYVDNTESERRVFRLLCGFRLAVSTPFLGTIIFHRSSGETPKLASARERYGGVDNSAY